ncbi:hypothetical protein JM93_01228 [Roseibium hamelinense]|uniref:Uncharacterized protein n=1 Tax=Roseibium hamelinense TaxID=150831 RepID=A0A562T9F3_9HYPH|nr:hypothetical protein [Roseibium hamelinense]MTI45380.1 hypothetical protein [Roseibium hamelinense]TWI90249.1 hypothetical protein JM93_01228 [Roseibium hamelinense]
MKRLVIYCPGYDIRPVKQTFGLINREFSAFLKLRRITGALSDLEDRPACQLASAKWEVQVEWPSGPVTARFLQLGWRDVIKPDFQRSWPRMAVDAIRSFWLYARADGYRAVLKSNWAHGLFCLYPAVGLVLWILVAFVPPLLFAIPAFRLANSLLPDETSGLFAGAIVVGASCLWIAAFQRFMSWLEPRIYLRYLINSWHFMARLAHQKHGPMQSKIEEFAEKIVALEAQADADEEIVFVSHSCGTFVAIYILAAILQRRPGFGQRRGGFAFVTLGPAFDCLGGFGNQGSFSEAMSAVARSDVDWTDIYSPHDPICGGRTPPVARYATMLSNTETRPEPRRYSARIPDRMPKELLNHLRYRFFKLHFCYFFASIRPDLFDFYELTFGPKKARDMLEAWSRVKS